MPSHVQSTGNHHGHPCQKALNLRIERHRDVFGYFYFLSRKKEPLWGRILRFLHRFTLCLLAFLKWFSFSFSIPLSTFRPPNRICLVPSVLKKSLVFFGVTFWNGNSGLSCQETQVTCLIPRFCVGKCDVTNDHVCGTIRSTLQRPPGARAGLRVRWSRLAGHSSRVPTHWSQCCNALPRTPLYLFKLTWFDAWTDNVRGCDPRRPVLQSVSASFTSTTTAPHGYLYPARVFYGLVNSRRALCWSTSGRRSCLIWWWWLPLPSLGMRGGCSVSYPSKSRCQLSSFQTAHCALGAAIAIAPLHLCTFFPECRLGV